MKNYFVYILSNKPGGTIYIGVTSDLVTRIEQHKSGKEKGFSGRYGLDRLVHVEKFTSILNAIDREKQLKRWHRGWKINLIERHNPTWNDLAQYKLN